MNWSLTFDLELYEGRSTGSHFIGRFTVDEALIWLADILDNQFRAILFCGNPAIMLIKSGIVPIYTARLWAEINQSSNFWMLGSGYEQLELLEDQTSG